MHRYQDYISERIHILHFGCFSIWCVFWPMNGCFSCYFIIPKYPSLQAILRNTIPLDPGRGWTWTFRSQVAHSAMLRFSNGINLVRFIKIYLVYFSFLDKLILKKSSELVVYDCIRIYCVVFILLLWMYIFLTTLRIAYMQFWASF